MYECSYHLVIPGHAFHSILLISVGREAIVLQGWKTFYPPLNADCHIYPAITMEFQNLAVVLVTEVTEFNKKE